MASTSNKPFHTYENVGYQAQLANAASDSANGPFVNATTIATNPITTAIAINNGNTINKTAIESPFPDPLYGKLTSSCHLTPQR